MGKGFSTCSTAHPADSHGGRGDAELSGTSPAERFLGLDALTIFIDIEAGGPGFFADESGWFASTKDLEATCLDLCVACRGHRSTRHVRVTSKTPRHLGILGEPEASRKKRETASRVPTLKVCRVTFAGGFNPRLDRAVWPETLTEIDLGGYFRRSVDKAVWPESLQKLKFGQYYNRPIDRTVFPRSLRELRLGYYFNHPIGKVTWPASLERLAFGVHFDQPIFHVVWPATLKEITFGLAFNFSIDWVAWPPLLERISFGERFHRPVHQVAWPGSLLEMTFGQNFPHGIDLVAWPASLQKLTLGNAFDQPIDGVLWPASLREITFGDAFNQRVAGVAWPTALEELTFCAGFTQPIDGVNWPPLLRRLTIHVKLCLPPSYGAQLPESLEHLTVGWVSSGDEIRHTVWPSSLRELVLMRPCSATAEDALRANDGLPASLKFITLNGVRERLGPDRTTD
ncbi:unnamed protein product [Scytosiphon promiscuus]